MFRGISPSLRKRLTVGAAPLLVAGLVVGTGAAVAASGVGDGAPAAAASVAAGTATNGTLTAAQTTASATSRHRLGRALHRELRADFAQGPKAGQRAQKIAAAIIARAKLFAALPAQLRTDLTALKNAPASARTADAARIKETALSGGYGPKIKALAERIRDRADHPGVSRSTAPARAASGATAGA